MEERRAQHDEILERSRLLVLLHFPDQALAEEEADGEADDADGLAFFASLRCLISAETKLDIVIFPF